MDEKVLLVDDVKEVREVLRKILEHYGYNVTTAASAEEAIEILKTQAFEVAICDVVLPGMSGLTLTEHIVNNYDTDVIVITGYCQDYYYEDVVVKGASDILFKPIKSQELYLRLQRVLKERKLNKDRNAMLEELKNLSITDALTQLYNSRHFHDHLELEVDRCVRYHHPLSLLLMDIDNFKAFNDTYGHLAGDKVLQMVGKNVKKCLRKMDTAFRYGGEEFTIILPETLGSDAEDAADRIRLCIEGQSLSFQCEDTPRITVSIGVTQYCPPEEPSSFVQRSDKAMYSAKQRGRNRIASLYAEAPSSV